MAFFLFSENRHSAIKNMDFQENPLQEKDKTKTK